MNNTYTINLKIVLITVLALGSLISLNGQQCSGASDPPCRLTQPFEISSGGTYLYKLEAKKEPRPSTYDFAFYVYSNQSLVVYIYDEQCDEVDDYTYTNNCMMPDSIYEELLTFSIELTCNEPVYYVAIELTEACMYPAYLYVECSGTIACEKLDCGDAGSLSCGSTVSSTTKNKVDNVTSYCNGRNTNFTGGEAVYKITPKISQEYTFVLSDIEQGDDLDMFLLSSCDQDECLATTDGSSSDVIMYDLRVNNTYYLVVDADEREGNGDSDFTLSVTGCCSSISQTENNFLFIPTGETSVALKFIENDNPLASGAKDIRWTQGSNDVGQGKSVDISINGDRTQRICVNWEREENGFDRCYTQCKDICNPIDYSCDLISYLPLGDAQDEYQFSIPNRYNNVYSWLLHDGSTEIEFRDDDISNSIVFNNLEAGKNYDVTVVYREDQNLGCFEVCSRQFCIEPAGDGQMASESNIFLRFTGLIQDVVVNNLYPYELKHNLPSNATAISWQYYPVNKPEEAKRIDGSIGSVELDKSKGAEYTVCLIYEMDDCLRIICDDFCLDFPADMCNSNDEGSCPSTDPYVTSELSCELGEVEVKIELPANYEIAYWIDDQGECYTTRTTNITVSPRGARGTDQYLDCYYRACATCCVSVKRIDIPYCTQYLPCNSTISSTLKGRPNEFTLESLNLNSDCESQLSSCPFSGVDEIIEFEKTGESFVLNLRQGENGLSLFVLDSEFNAVTVLDADGATLCKGQNVDANGFVVSNSESVGEIFSDINSPLPNGQYYAVIQGGCLNSENFEDNYTLELTCISAPCSAPDNDFDIEFSPPALDISLFGCESTFPEGTDLRVSPRFRDTPSKIDYMELYIDEQRVSRQTSDPYEWIQSNMQPGTYEVTLKLVDECGNSKEENCTVIILPKEEETCEDISFSILNIIDYDRNSREPRHVIHDPEGVTANVFTGDKDFDHAYLSFSQVDQLEPSAIYMKDNGDLTPFIFWSKDDILNEYNRVHSTLFPGLRRFSAAEGLSLTVNVVDKCGKKYSENGLWYSWSKPGDRCPDPEMADTSFTRRDVVVSDACFDDVSLSEDDFDQGVGAGVVSTYNQTPTRHMGAGLNYRFESDNFNDNDSAIDSVATMIEDEISDFNSVGLKWGTTLSGGFEYNVTRSDIFSLYAAYSFGASYELRDDSDLFGIGYSSQSDNFYTDMNIGCYSEELMENVDPGYLGPIETDGFAELHDYDQFALRLMTRFFKAPITKSMQGDTFRLNFKLMIYQNECLSDLWFEYEGDRATADNCELLYEEGHDLSIKIDGDYLPNIEEVSLAFEDQILIDAEAPFEWTDIEKNMSPGTYPITITAITFCNDTIRRACNVVIAADPCDSDFWFMYEQGRSDDMNCEMTYKEGEDIWIHLGGSNLPTVREATLSYKGIELVDKSFPFEWTDYERNMSPGRYPVSITIVDTTGNEFIRECTIVITDCEMTFDEGHNLSVGAGGNWEDISEATLFFMDSTYQATNAPYEWIDIATDMAIGTYPMSMTIMDDCDSIIAKACMITVEERICGTDYWFDVDGYRTSASVCVMNYPEGHNLSLYAGGENPKDIKQVTFIFGAQAFVDIDYPFEWIDVATNMAIGTTKANMFITTKCESNYVVECDVVIEPEKCEEGYYFDFFERNTETAVKSDDRLFENIDVNDATKDELFEFFKVKETEELKSNDQDQKVEEIGTPDLGVEEKTSALKRLEAEQNKPNPFDQSTVLRFYNPVNSDVDVLIIDISGKEVHSKENFFQKGWHEITIESKDLSGPGVYFFELSNGYDRIKKKMISM